jgi:hypothetical protein
MTARVQSYPSYEKDSHFQKLIFRTKGVKDEEELKEIKEQKSY